MELNMILPLVGSLAALAVLVAVVLVKKRTAYLGPVKEELQKEKGWLRRGEYNAAMVKGRQNLELLFKLVAEKNGIQLDNTAKAQADAREEAERQSQNGRANGKNRGGRKKTPKVMTHHQFNRWLSENGYLDRVARWEVNQVRIIGNKAVHENYADKDDAWNQFNYLEDILKTVTERSQNPKKHHEQSKRRDGAEGQAERKQEKSRNGGGAKAQGKQKQAQNVNEAQVQGKKRKKRNVKGQQAKNDAVVQKQTAESVKEPQTQSAEMKSAPAMAQDVQTEQETTKKKRRRRRKSVKKQEPVVQKPVPAAAEKKENDQEAAAEAAKKKPAAHKRRRRRRRPQNAQSVKENASNSSGEQ